MVTAFYIAAAVAVLATVRVITGRNAFHALLYLVVSLLAVAVVFFVVGAPFVAALEVMVYAGAIMVLFIFVVMLLGLGEEGVRQERTWVTPRAFVGPAILAAVLVGVLIHAIADSGAHLTAGTIEARRVSRALFGPYVLSVELASFLLLAGLVGAYHLGRRERGRRNHGGRDPR